MKFASAGAVVLAMSASFIVILVIMLVTLRPERRRHAAAPPRPPDVRKADRGGSPLLRQNPEAADPAVPAAPTTPLDSAATRQDSAGKPTQAAKPLVAQDVPAHGQTQYWKLQQERKEVVLLKKEMQERLKEKEGERKRQIARLAETCTRLKPDEAAQVLLELDDDTLKQVLRRMDREKALRTAAFLDALGRKEALSFVEKQANPTGSGALQ